MKKKRERFPPMTVTKKIPPPLGGEKSNSILTPTFLPPPLKSKGASLTVSRWFKE